MPDPIREPDQIRRGCARKLRGVQVSEHFQAIIGCLLAEHWTTPWLVEMVITPDGHVLGRCEGEASFKAFLGAAGRSTTSAEITICEAQLGAGAN
jgi:hypothetical protein